MGGVNMRGAFAVLSVDIADELIRRGYELRGQSELAWYFDDTEEIEAIVTEMVAQKFI